MWFVLPQQYNVIVSDVLKKKVLELDGVCLGKLVRLMYLLDSGDPSMGSSNSQRRRNTTGAAQSRHAFLSILLHREWGTQWLSTLVEMRAQELLHQVFIELPVDTAAADWAVRGHGEELLVLVEACHYLNIKHQHLQTKVTTVQKMLKLTETEKRGSFFLYAENLLLSRMCDNLTSSQVYNLYCVTKDNREFHRYVDSNFYITEAQVKDEEGLKEVLFFYLIRVLECNGLLNRIYTDNLRSLLQDVMVSYVKEEEEKRCIRRAMDMLQSYPNECQPPGLCVIFCVTGDRAGADYEVAKIESVFQDRLGFTVMTEKDPSRQTLESYAADLQKTKYNFYDLFVFWFVSHGSENEIMLADREPYSREDFIYNFSLPDNFRKKPKIFFMATCRGSKTIQVKDVGEC